MIAAQLNNQHLCELLAKYEAGVTSNKDGKSTLQYAAESGPDCVQTLIMYKRELELKDCDGNSALMTAVSHNNLRAVKLLA